MVENPVHDWHATVLHRLGLDRERLASDYWGPDSRLADIHGDVVRGYSGEARPRAWRATTCGMRRPPDPALL